MLAGFAAMLAGTRTSRATAPLLFGYGPQSTALAQSDIESPDPAASAYTNPASACEPGTRLLAGHAYAWTDLTIDDRAMPLRGIAGTDLAFQLGRRIGRRWQLGGAVAAHLPDESLAQISFRPGSEPSFVRFEPSPQRAVADAVLAARYAALSAGAGVSVLADARGDVGFLLGQDGNGTYADGATNVELPYRLAPLVGVGVDLGPVGIAGRFRGAQAVGLDLATRADVSVTGNPLNGTTLVTVAGQSGYVPATWDIGARWNPSRELRLTGALQLARWSRAPSNTAEVTMAVRLGLSPGQIEARFVRPSLRDTLSPRCGVTWTARLADRPVDLRVGYAYSPSPVPEQTGLTSWADAPAHIIGVGTGVELGQAWGIALRADLAAQLWMLRERTFDKPSEVLPFAHYRAGGRLFDLSAAMEAAWR
jgi:hypothetical protein